MLKSIESKNLKKKTNLYTYGRTGKVKFLKLVVTENFQIQFRSIFERSLHRKIFTVILRKIWGKLRQKFQR